MSIEDLTANHLARDLATENVGLLNTPFNFICLFLFLVCNFVSHERCMQLVVTPCISIATSLVKVS